MNDDVAHDSSHATSGDIASTLVAMVVDGLSQLSSLALPGLRLPGVFAGHPMGDDTRSDLVYVLSLLASADVTMIGETDLRQRALDELRRIDPSAVEGFYAYRVAESVAHLGGLESIAPEIRASVVEASGSPRLMAALDDPRSNLSPNYVVVAARCQRALTALGVSAGRESTTVMVERVRAMFAQATSGWINDGKRGNVQFDIYTPDMYLLAEPLAQNFRDEWLAGFSKVVRDLDDLAHLDGAVVWGRSIGALAQVMTIEIGGAAARWTLLDPSGRWLSRIPEALGRLQDWFTGGLVNAHQHRTSDSYRGPARRLQMTLDIYGKLLLAARHLLHAPEISASPYSEDLWPPVDRLVRFNPSETSAAWTYRSRHLSFVLPLMSGYSADYLPTPRSPNLFEQPVAGPPAMIPTVAVRAATGSGTYEVVQLVPSGLPTELHHQAGQVTTRHEFWAPIGEGPQHPAAAAGSRTATYRVWRRTLEVKEVLTFRDPSQQVLSLSIGERSSRPLAFTAGPGGATAAIDTSGVSEWRSCWGELSTVHQFETAIGPVVKFAWSVTPILRVASTDLDHQYSRSLYGHMQSRVVATDAGPADRGLTRRLLDVDMLHLAWPERWIGVDLVQTQRVIKQIQDSGTPIVWTQHNLVPHRAKNEEGAAAYALWAQAADLVIHHTRYGQRTALSAYQYGQHTQHVVIPHGHWGDQYKSIPHLARADVERMEGWPSTGLRIGVVGQPRVEKDLQTVVDAFAECDRRDIQLVARISESVRVPRDDRIIVDYGHLTAERFHTRVGAFDAVLFPFASHGMLATGTAFDCIGAGLAAITSDWEFLDETFGDAAICYGSSQRSLVSCLEGLTDAQITESRDAVIALQPRFEWTMIAEQTGKRLEELVDGS